MTGTGTSADPYKVTTWSELMTVLPQFGAYAVLDNDIDMKGRVITDSGVILGCDFDGQNHTIKNVYLNSDNMQNPELFKMYYENSFRNVKFENWYSNGRHIFSGDSSSPSMRRMPTIENLSFSGELTDNFNSHTSFVELYSLYYIPIFKNCSAFIIADDVNGIISATNNKPIFENSKIEVYGTCGHDIMSVTLNDSHLTGEIELTSIGENPALNISTSQTPMQSLVELVVNSIETWEASFNGSKLLVNTTKLGNVSTTGTFIGCNLLEQDDVTFLNEHGFVLGDVATDFSWHDYLASINKAGWWDDNSSYVDCPYSVTDDEYTITVTDLPTERTTNTEPYLDWQTSTYYFTAEPYKKYKFVFSASLPDEVAPRYSVYSNGVGSNDYRRSGIGYTTIIDAFDNTTKFSLQAGVRNQTDSPISGTYTIQNLSIYEHSSWNVVNGKLVNLSIPNVKPIGAFYNCGELKSINIPEDVKKIGPYAFYNTALTKVKIAQDCKYYHTSFPNGCEIEYY